MIRRILWLSLALGPLVIALDATSALSETLLFAIAALSLIPLAWLIGEATEHVSVHTGPGVGAAVPGRAAALRARRSWCWSRTR